MRVEHVYRVGWQREAARVDPHDPLDEQERARRDERHSQAVNLRASQLASAVVVGHAAAPEDAPRDCPMRQR